MAISLKISTQHTKQVIQNMDGCHQMRIQWQKGATQPKIKPKSALLLQYRRHLN